MAEEQPSLHIDTDWKKQAQEEKRRLAEQEQKRAAEREQQRSAPAGGAAGMGMGDAGGAAPSAPGAAAGAATRGRAGAGAAPGGRGGERAAAPEAAFGTLINSLLTQVLLYLGDLAPRGAEPQVNLDMAKFNVDLLGVLDEKTRGNLSAEEQRLLDSALYEARMRYVSVASQYATV